MFLNVSKYFLCIRQFSNYYHNLLILNRAVIRNILCKDFFVKFSSNISMEKPKNSTKTEIEKENTIASRTIPVNNQESPIIITEGKASISFDSQGVFYNPVQEFNRDLSVAVIKQFVKTIPTTARGLYEKLRKKNRTKEITLLEALSASGLRSIRYALEIKGVNKIIANDMSSDAYNSILKNIKKNGVEDVVAAENEEATLLMYKNKRKFDIVDIDPYGTAGIFLDAAVQAVPDGGLLMVTCTDMAILCGNGPEACRAKYGAMSAKVPYCHEMALRIVLQSIEVNANKYGRYIEPLLSLSADFYIRLFVKLFSGPAVVKKSVCKLSNVFICRSCYSFYLQPLGEESTTEKGSKFVAKGLPVDRRCSICNGEFKVCGPIWSENIHNKEFVHDLLQSINNEQSCFGTSKRMLGVLNVIYEELDDCPLYHTVNKLCSKLFVISPPMLSLRSAILNAGYQVSLSHTSPCSVKTDAPQHVIWDIVRSWASENGGKKTFEVEPSKTIMSKQSSIKVSFEERPDANPESRMQGLVRFPENPEPFWGPKARAKISLKGHELQEKSKQNQGKKQKNILSDDDMKADSRAKKLKNEDKQVVS